MAKHNGFNRQKQEVYLLPIIISDSGNPPLSSTSTLTIRVCGCSSDGVVQSCNVEAYVLPIGLSMGALIAILACIILLLGTYFLHSLMVTIFLVHKWQYIRTESPNPATYQYSLEEKLLCTSPSFEVTKRKGRKKKGIVIVNVQLERTIQCLFQSHHQ